MPCRGYQAVLSFLGGNCAVLPKKSVFSASPLVHVFPHQGKGSGGFGIVCLKVHQLPQPALVCHDAAAFGVNQFINQRGMPHRVVRWVLLYAAQYGVVLIKSLLHGRGNREASSSAVVTL